MKQKTLTIAIPAYNEAETIVVTVNDILKQKIPSWVKLKEILVISDGSTDATVSLCHNISDKRVRVIAHTTQRGKNARLNELFTTVKTDIIVLFDADIHLHGNQVVAQLVQPFLTYSTIGLVAGNPHPLPAVTLVERAVNNWIHALIDIRGRFNNGNSPYSVCGPALALSYDFFKNLVIPKTAPSDRYLFFACLTHRFAFKYVPLAKVFFRSAQTVEDHILQNRRYQSDYRSLEMVVGKETVQKAFRLPIILKLRLLIVQLVRDPIAYAYMKYLHSQVVRGTPSQSNVTWKSVRSSKKLSL